MYPESGMKYSVKSNVDSVNNVKSHYSKCKEIVEDDERLGIGSSSESDNPELSNSDGEESSDEDMHKEEMNDITFNINKHDFKYDKDSDINYETNPDEDSYKKEMNGISFNANKHDSEFDISSDFEHETDSDRKSEIHIEEMTVLNLDSKHDSENDKSSNFNHETTSDEDSFSDVDNSKNKHELSGSKGIQITDLDKKKAHDYSKNRSNVNEEKRTQMTADGEIRKYKCCMCNKTFKLKHHLNQHILTHTDMRTKLPKTHKCQTCSKAFKMKHHLERHVLTHTKEKLFKCSYCNKSYVANYDLKIHISKKHFINGNQLNGNICNEKKSNSELKKPLPAHDLTCDICEKVFSARKYLIYHVRTHLKMTSFMCDICGKAFRFNSSLVEHIRSHTNERPYECDICNKTFSTKFNQNRHKKSHFPKEHCNSCSRIFSDKEKFQSHIKKCKVKKRCDKCGWEFIKLSNYKRHLIVHRNYSKSDVLKNDDKDNNKS